MGGKKWKISREVEAVLGKTSDPGKCTKLHVLSASRNARFLSSLRKASLSSVKIVSPRKENSDFIIAGNFYF